MLGTAGDFDDGSDATMGALEDGRLDVFRNVYRRRASRSGPGAI